MKMKKYPTWRAVAQVLSELGVQLVDLHEHVPDGVSPRKFRSELQRARLAINRASAIASDRSHEDTMRERKAALSKQRSEGIPELPQRLPVALRPGSGW